MNTSRPSTTDSNLDATPGREEPWIETPEGMFFFVNALFVIPEYCVLLPLGLRTLLRALEPAAGPSVFLDTLPALANYFLPFVGWILLLPIGLVFKNFTVERSGLRRAALALFLLSHAGFLGYTVYLWFGA